MHPLLRTLNLAAIADTETSVYDLHPIRDSATSRSRGIPLLVSLGLTPLLIYGLSVGLVSPSSRQAIYGAVDRARRSVTLQLLEQETPSSAKPPARGLLGPEGPGGAGHQEGTGTLDPRLAAHTSLFSKPSDAIDPDELSASPGAERVDVSLNPALPGQTGGNGLARGAGRDSALGGGGITRAPIPVATPDFKLIPTRQIQLSHQVSAGEEPLLAEPPQVRILIGEDGVPFQATMVSGSPKLRDKAIKAALAWRFEPLGPHGLKPPLVLVITFRRRH
jgi:hypothetical protein